MKNERPEKVRSEPLLFPALYNPENVLPHHRGNPLLEALPRFQSARDILGALAVAPEFSESDRKAPAHLRMLSVLELSNFFTPLNAHFSVVEQIGLTIYNGYAHRNPSTKESRKAQIELYRSRVLGNATISIDQPAPSTAPSFSVFGVSGMGKSSIIERILAFYPQAIQHEEHHYLQLVWLKVDCPLDGSLKQLLLSIINDIDEKLGTEHSAVLTSRTEVDKLVIQVSKVASQHHLGVLVIDEIQNLLDAPGVGTAKMLNFFVTLANVIKVPFVLVGTPKAETMLKLMFREARRASDKGTVRWDRMAQDEEWDHFIRELWPYQWTAKAVPPTKSLLDAMYRETQGITALAVRLYQLVQLEAIRSEEEIITTALISRVAEENFSLLANALAAIRSGNKKEIALFEDFFRDFKAATDEKLADSSGLTQPSIRKSTEKAKDKLKDNLLEMGVSKDRAASVANVAFAVPEPVDDIQQQVATWLDSEDPERSLVAIAKRAALEGTSNSQAFLQAGIIWPS